MQRSGSTNALYVDSFISPLLEPLADGGELPPESMEALGGLLEGTSLGETIVSFKVWSLSGEVLYSTDERLIGETFRLRGICGRRWTTVSSSR